MQDLHGLLDRLRSARLRPHGHVYELRQANVRVSHMSPVCGPSGPCFQSLKFPSTIDRFGLRLSFYYRGGC